MSKNKQCYRCSLIKNLEEFSFKDKERDRRQAHCKACQRDISKKWYKKNKTKHLKTVAKHNQNYKDRFQEYKEKLHCQVCDENTTECLDFHHKDPRTKTATVSSMISRGRPWSLVLEEIAKCVVLCANCHRKIHAGLINCP